MMRGADLVLDIDDGMLKILQDGSMYVNWRRRKMEVYGNGRVRLNFDHPVLESLGEETRVVRPAIPQHRQRGWSCDPLSERTKRLFSAAGAAVRCGRRDVAVDLLDEIHIPPDAPVDWRRR